MTIGDNVKAQLRSFRDRIDRLEDEKKAIADDIRDCYLEAKGQGLDVKALRAIIRLGRQDPQERAEHEAILETYMHALGMLSDTPLGQAAIARDLAPKPRVDVSNPPFAPPGDLDLPDELRR